jgi:hypothetical protein
MSFSHTTNRRVAVDTILKTLLEERLFVLGVDELHNEFNDPEFRNSDLAHLLTNRLTYVNELDADTVFNADAIVIF